MEQHTTQVEIADQGVCVGVSGCRTRVSVDVNGDGRRDSVGLASRGADSSRAAIVRVKTSASRIVSTRWRAPFWSGDLWQGATRLDSRAGHDLMIGQTMGAHTEFFRALTWRNGTLATLDAPGHPTYWVIDGAVGVSMGWRRAAGEAPGTIQQRVAVRTGDPVRSPFKGTINRFRWANGTGTGSQPHHSSARGSNSVLMGRLPRFWARTLVTLK